jgi:hypothetical protein
MYKNCKINKHNKYFTILIHPVINKNVHNLLIILFEIEIANYVFRLLDVYFNFRHTILLTENIVYQINRIMEQKMILRKRKRLILLLILQTSRTTTIQHQQQ